LTFFFNDEAWHYTTVVGTSPDGKFQAFDATQKNA